MYYTTLNRIRECVASPRSLSKLLKLLGKTSVDDEPMRMSTILASNGIEEAVWCLRALDDDAETAIKMFAVWCANQARHLMRDKRSKDALVVAENFLNGLVSKKELAAAVDAAYAAYADAAAAYNTAYADADAIYADYTDADTFSATLSATLSATCAAYADAAALRAAAKAARAAAEAAKAALADTTSDAAKATYAAYAATEAALASRGEALLSMREKFREIFCK